MISVCSVGGRGVIGTMRVCRAMRFGSSVAMVMPVIVIVMIMGVLMRGIVGHGCTAKKGRRFSFKRFRASPPVFKKTY
jgi:hypothetical protein